MSVYAFVSLCASIISAYLGVRTLFHERGHSPNWIFFLVCVSYFVIDFDLGVVYFLLLEHEPFPREAVWFFLRLAFVGTFFILSLNLHFFLVLTGTRSSCVVAAAAYIPAAVLAVANCLGYALYSDIVRRAGVFYLVIDPTSLWYYLYLCFDVACLSAVCWLIVRWRRRAKTNKDKIYSKYLLVSTMIMYLSSAAVFVLPSLGFYESQHAGVVLFYLYLFGLYFLVTKYRFLSASTAVLADEILANINAMVLILDRSGVVTFANRRVFAVLGRSDVQGERYSGIVNESKSLHQRLDQANEGAISDFIMRVDYKKDKEPVATNTYVSAVRDKYRDVAGFLVISSEIREAIHFQQRFGITRRELQIVELTVCGYTYKQIAGDLDITEKTVETHLTHIYNKLGIQNKVELIRVASEFNIMPVREAAT